MKVNLVSIRVCMAAASLVALNTQATTITFDDLTAGVVLSSQYAGQGVAFSANAFSGANTNSTTQGWATNTGMTIAATGGADVSTLGTPSLVSGNLLHGFNGWLAENGDPSILVTFSAPITFFSLDFAGVTGSNAAFADVKLFAYNGATLLGSVAGPAVAPSATSQFTLSFAAAAITRVAVAPGSYADWVGVDNLTYTLAAVPEPQSYALMALGVVAIGVRRLRRKTRPG